MTATGRFETLTSAVVNTFLGIFIVRPMLWKERFCYSNHDCPSVTLRYSVKMVKDIVKILSQTDPLQCSQR